MIFNIATALGFGLVLSAFSIGALGSLIFQKNDKLANQWGSWLAIIGSLGGLVFSLAIGLSSKLLEFSVNISSFSLLSFSFTIDLLSAFFIFVISLITLFSSIYSLGYSQHYFKKYNLGTLGFMYNLFIIGMLLVVTAANGLFFLIAWEVMAVASYFLVVYDRQDQDNIKAGTLYLIMTHIGTAFIILAFLLLYRFTGSFDFSLIKSGVGLIPLGIKNIIFVLTLIGFGTKAGIVPLHIWLPSAHPAAPSHVSALMSGVMIKTGIFMMIRFFLDILQPVPLWWGITLLLIGAISSLLGVLYALTEHDIKRLLAYHSIENIGIILLGLGSSLVFSSLNMPALALLGLVAALFHTLNHATFKSLLFLGAGSVINATHTRNMEEYGGLIKLMPLTALFFLVGSMAISALPPFNGFFSEWLTFQVLFQGMATLSFSTQWIFIAAAGSLAFTGGLALACFVKAFGATFLARPRSNEAKHAKESALSLRLGMAALALIALLLGIFSGFVTSVLETVGKSLTIFQDASSFVSVSANQDLVAGNNFASVNAWILAASLLVAFIVVLLLTKYTVYRQQKSRVGATWDCGTDLTPRMEITATGFARSIIVIFRGILRPSLQHDIEYHDEESRYLPKARTVTISVSDIYLRFFYKPVVTSVVALSHRTKNIQSGNVNMYIMYIFVALLLTLIISIQP